MSHTNLIAALAGAVAGAATFGMLTVLGGEPEVASAAAGTDAVSPQRLDAADADLAEELTRLTAANEMLAQRVAALEARPGGDALATRTAVADEVEPLSLEEVSALRQLVAGADPVDPTVPAGLYGSVAKVVSDLEAQEEAERAERRREAELQRIDERLDEMVPALGLNGYQRDEMYAVLVERMDARDTLFQEIRESGDWFGMRDQMGDLMTGYEERIEGLLAPDQYESYREEFSGGRGGFGGGPGRFGGGPRGN